ncbi:IS5 family transposase [Glycomyces tarimensis]
MLHTGIGWEHLPQELGFGSGMTCWRRLDRWCQSGVFEGLHRLLLARLHAAGQLDWSRVCVDASHLKAKRGGVGVGPSPVDRGKPGSKHHVVCDGAGLPLKVITTGGNVPDIAMAETLIAAIPPVAGRVGRPRSKPDAILADKGYDSIAFRTYLKRRGILAVISQRKRRDIIGLGNRRWVVERTISHLHQFKRLAVRWERRLDLHEALTSLASALICWRRLERMWAPLRWHCQSAPAGQNDGLEVGRLPATRAWPCRDGGCRRGG